MNHDESTARHWCAMKGYTFVAITLNPPCVWYDHRINEGPLGLSRGCEDWGHIERDLAGPMDVDVATMTEEQRKQLARDIVKDFCDES